MFASCAVRLHSTCVPRVARRISLTTSCRPTTSTPGPTRLGPPPRAMCCANRIVYFRKSLAQMAGFLFGTFRHWPAYCRVAKVVIFPCFTFETLIAVFIFAGFNNSKLNNFAMLQSDYIGCWLYSFQPWTFIVRGNSGWRRAGQMPGHGRSLRS